MSIPVKDIYTACKARLWFHNPLKSSVAFSDKVYWCLNWSHWYIWPKRSTFVKHLICLPSTSLTMLMIVQEYQKDTRMINTGDSSMMWKITIPINSIYKQYSMELAINPDNNYRMRIKHFRKKPPDKWFSPTIKNPYLGFGRFLQHKISEAKTGGWDDHCFGEWYEWQILNIFGAYLLYIIIYNICTIPVVI